MQQTIKVPSYQVVVWMVSLTVTVTYIIMIFLLSIFEVYINEYELQKSLKFMANYQNVLPEMKVRVNHRLVSALYTFLSMYANSAYCSVYLFIFFFKFLFKLWLVILPTFTCCLTLVTLFFCWLSWKCTTGIQVFCFKPKGQTCSMSIMSWVPVKLQCLWIWVQTHSHELEYMYSSMSTIMYLLQAGS